MSIPVEKRDLADGWTLTCRGAGGGDLTLTELIIKVRIIYRQLFGLISDRSLLRKRLFSLIAYLIYFIHACFREKILHAKVRPSSTTTGIVEPIILHQQQLTKHYYF
jgi:hypothetical protein